MYIANAPKRAGFYPAAVYLCTFWYMPKDLAYRVSIFYCASALSGAFSGLLAAGIAQMHGIGGQEGWRWIFILEGLATVVLGVMCFFLLIDSPRRSSKWLSPDEIRYLELQHFIKEGGNFKDQRRRVSWEELKTVFLNWRLYLLAYILLCQSASAYGWLTSPHLWFARTHHGIHRSQIHHAYYHEGHGVHQYERATHGCAPVYCGCHLRHLFLEAVRPLLLANALRCDPVDGRHDWLLNCYLFPWTIEGEHWPLLLRHGTCLYRPLPDPPCNHLMVGQQPGSIRAQSHWPCSLYLHWQYGRRYRQLHVHG